VELIRLDMSFADLHSFWQWLRVIPLGNVNAKSIAVILQKNDAIGKSLCAFKLWIRCKYCFM